MDMALYETWKQKYRLAQENMANRVGDGVLIEVAAQHPLVDGRFPNEEFEKRLLLALSLYKQLKSLASSRVRIYIPGSIHMENGQVDQVSLSEAGTRFLTRHGVPGCDLYGEDMNQKFKGDAGVYNSSDECFVASKIFESEGFLKLHCVCSSAQAMRKVLSYIYFGYVPYVHTVSCDKMYHSYIDEVFRDIPILLADGTALQGSSEEAARLRHLRKPL